ncbi:hypothetical protein [Streptomyces sp. JW3]|uniref:hypothetical protein n=1 Tax=Streptomyces sp. JW3 TaxID=3456955 RepID=UPI003FA47548
MSHKACPTCGTMQDFRQLTGEEKAAVREEKGDRYYVGDLWRCGAAGCRWYQPFFRTSGGGLLPERFGQPAAAEDA